MRIYSGLENRKRKFIQMTVLFLGLAALAFLCGCSGSGKKKTESLTPKPGQGVETPKENPPTGAVKPREQLPDGGTRAAALCDAITNGSDMMVKTFLVPSIAGEFEISDKVTGPAAQLVQIYKTSRAFRTCAADDFFVAPCGGSETDDIKPFPLNALRLEPGTVKACAEFVIHFNLSGTEQVIPMNAFLINGQWLFSPVPEPGWKARASENPGFDADAIVSSKPDPAASNPKPQTSGAASQDNIYSPKPTPLEADVFPTPISLAQGYCAALKKRNIEGFLFLFLPKFADSIRWKYFDAGAALAELKSCEILQTKEVNCSTSEIMMDTSKRADIIGSDLKFLEACGMIIVHQSNQDPDTKEITTQTFSAEIFKIAKRWYMATLKPVKK